MTALVEHIAAIVGVIALVLLAWSWVRYHQRHLTAEERQRMEQHYRERSPGWHPVDDKEGTTRAH